MGTETYNGYKSDMEFYYFYTQGSVALAKIKDEINSGNKDKLDTAVKALSPAQKRALDIGTCEIIPERSFGPVHDAGYEFFHDAEAQKLVTSSVERLKCMGVNFPASNLDAITDEVDFLDRKESNVIPISQNRMLYSAVAIN